MRVIALIIRAYDTWLAVTATPHFSTALWTIRGFAGAPLGVVNANQQLIAGQSDLLTTVGLPLTICSDCVLGTGLLSPSSSLSSLSSILPFFFPWVATALKKNAAFGIPEKIQSKLFFKVVKLSFKISREKQPRAESNLKFLYHTNPASCRCDSRILKGLFLWRWIHILHL